MKKKFEIRTLNELLELNESGTWGEEGNANDYPVLRSSNIHDGKLVLNDVAFRKVSSRDAQRYKLDDGDIIVTKSSGSPHLIGKSCLFKNPDGRTYLFSNFTQRLRAKKNFIYPSFLYFFLQSPIAKDFLQKISNTTSGLRNLNMKDYDRQLIPIPPLPIQKQIAAILEKADAAREKRRQANKLTEQFLQSAFLEMFGDYLNETKKCPWKTTQDATHFIDYRGKTPRKSESGVRLITARNVKEGYLSAEPREYVFAEDYEQWMTRGFPQENDVLFTTEAPLGNVAKLGKFDKVVVGQRIITLQCGEELNADYLMFSLMSKEIQGQILRRSTGSTVKGIRSKEFAQIKIPIPPLIEQQKFAALVEKVELLRAKQRESEKELENLFNALMQRAFKGELVQ